MKRMLIVGGTGIIGRPLVEIALKSCYDVSVIANSGKENIPPEAHYYESDRKNEIIFGETLRRVTGKDKWDILVDINPYNQRDAQVLRDSIGEKAAHLFILSTTLVYNREKISFVPIAENNPLASRGKQGKYVDDKVELERFWKATNLNWTLLRPYHVLGAGSFLGCLPSHNRDPHLPEFIQREMPITLADGGRIPLNIIHPRDLGEIILRAANNPLTFRKAYNAVNPTEIIAREYFKEIADQLAVTLRIRAEKAEHFWRNPNGWSLTTFPHLYDMKNLREDIGYVPTTSLRECIRDALEHRPKFDNASHAAVGTNVLDVPVHNNMNKKPYPQEHPDYAEPQ